MKGRVSDIGKPGTVPHPVVHTDGDDDPLRYHVTGRRLTHDTVLPVVCGEGRGGEVCDMWGEGTGRDKWEEGRGGV